MAWTPKRLALILIDLALLAACWVLAYNLRWAETGIPQAASLNGDDYQLQMRLLLFPAVLTHVVLLWALQLYRGIWRYSGITELRTLLIGAAIWSVGWYGFSFYLDHQEAFFDLPQRLLKDGETQVLRIPLAILAIYIMLGTMVMGGIRLLPRMLTEVTNRSEAADAPATLIVGAGDLADGVIRNIQRAGSTEFRIICGVAQVPARVGMRLHGVPVVATLDKLPEVIRENKIERVLIALDSQTPAELRRVVLSCEKEGVSFRIVPSLSDLESGRVEIAKMREIEVEDLLGREPVKLEIPADRNYIKGEIVLITGAGGSIGSELSRQCAAAGAAKLVLVGKGENSIFEIEGEIRRLYPNLAVAALIADVREPERIEAVFRAHRPAIVFHAAAHKHVPLMESAPDEAIKNNILGTASVAIMADRYQAKRFVLISTDKAVRPSSVMGATKRIAEMVVFSIASQSRTCFQAVRFGNVLGSRGSVIPTFRRQIAAGGPVTVTHPDVTRYFMTIPEAVSLVLQAGSRNRNGALYLLDMGEPVRIADLARNMITLSGLRPDVDIAVQYVGLRPGEKLREELLTEYEGATKTELDKIFETRPEVPFTFAQIIEQLEYCRDLAETANHDNIRQWLRSIVPDYHSGQAAPSPESVAQDIRALAAPVAAPEPEVALTEPEPIVPEPAEVPAEPPAPQLGEQTDLLEMSPEPEAPASVEAPAPVEPELPIEAEVREPEPEAPASAPAPAEEPAEPIAEVYSEEPIAFSEAPAAEIQPADPQPFPALQTAADETAIFRPLSEAVAPYIEEPAPEVDLAPEVDASPRGFSGPLSEEFPRFGSEELAATFGSEEPGLLVDSSEKPVAPASANDEMLNIGEKTESQSASPLAHADSEGMIPTLDREDVGASAEDFSAQQPAYVESGFESIPVGAEAPAESSDEVLAEMARTPMIVALRVAKAMDQQTLGQLVQVLSGTLGADDKLVVIGDYANLAGVPAGTATVTRDGKAEGAAFAEAIALAPKAGILLTTSAEVIFTPGAFETFSEALSAKGAVAYSDYREDRDGAVSEVKLHDHEGCPHERFEFGPVIAYRLADVAKVGGIRKDLNYAWEYDLHLKLMELAEFAHITQFTYTRFVPVVVDDKGKKVFSPGMGPLGGFSYVFYPADVEKEVTSVFEEALKRRGAWIDHPAVPVNHGNRDFPLLASIVIPILNRVKYIGNAIEKVQHGTFQNFEMVIVDNGSTDGTIEAVQKIAAADPRIRLLHGKGGSIASALNEGIKAARGKYICQLDSDDEYAPDCLEQMIGHLESHPNCGLAISYYRLMDENGVIIDDVAPITHSGYSRNQILRRDGGGAVRIFPKAVLEEFGYYDEVHYGNFGEDYDMVLKTGEKYDVDRVHKVLYHYRRHSDNTDVTRDPAMKYKNKNRARQEALRRRKEINKKLGKA